MQGGWFRGIVAANLESKILILDLRRALVG